MQEAFITIDNVPTHIITWGRWIEESLTDVKEIVICVTGNPGLPGFYTSFLAAVHEKLNAKIPVWVIGHQGHDEPRTSSLYQVPELKSNENLYDLDGQLNHKIKFIEKYVPENCKIHLIGHSIGAWMILELLAQENIRKRVQKCYLLFPTIERMLISPNGWIFNKIALPLYLLFGFLMSLLNFLPFCRLFLIRLYFWLTSIPNHFEATALKYTQSSILEKVIFLAKDEMKRVVNLRKDIIVKNQSLLKFYYGTTDGWVPIKYYKELKNDFPSIDAILDDKKIDHAFVLRYSLPMSDIVADMINNNSVIN